MENLNSEEIITSLVNRVTPIKGKYSQFCDRTGIGYEWLLKFVNGRITNPTIGSLQALGEAIDLWND